MNRTSLELYRDCLRLVKHLAPGTSPKARSLRQMIKQQFHQNANETNPQSIEVLKANAIRGLSNYMLYQSSTKDEKLKNAMKKSESTIITNRKKNKQQQEQQQNIQDN